MGLFDTIRKSVEMIESIERTKKEKERRKKILTEKNMFIDEAAPKQNFVD